MMLRPSLVLLLGMSFGVHLRAQFVPVRVLLQPEATFHHGFTRVQGVRELKDGRVIVLDVDDRTVHGIDSAWATMTQIGREGDGPREYRRPTQLFALPHDSSAVMDWQNLRMLVITPDAKPGGFLSQWGSPQTGHSRSLESYFSTAGIMLHPPGASDGRGYFYCRAEQVVVSGEGELVLADSVAIERWTGNSAKRDTVGFMPKALMPGSEIGAGSVGYPPLDPIPAFPARNQWAVGLDGRVAVVTHDPYQVKFIDATGDVVIGAPIQYEPLRVTDAHKREWREQQQERVPMLIVTRGGKSGVVQTTPEPVEPAWPRYLPPFLLRAVHFASDGMLWVQRTTAADEVPTFDIIDGTGRVVQQTKLQSGRRLVGFGNGSVYLVRIDEVDLEYLEKYDLVEVQGS